MSDLDFSSDCDCDGDCCDCCDCCDLCCEAFNFVNETIDACCPDCCEDSNRPVQTPMTAVNGHQVYTTQTWTATDGQQVHTTHGRTAANGQQADTRDNRKRQNDPTNLAPPPSYDSVVNSSTNHYGQCDATQPFSGHSDPVQGHDHAHGDTITLQPGSSNASPSYTQQNARGTITTQPGFGNSPPIYTDDSTQGDTVNTRI